MDTLTAKVGNVLIGSSHPIVPQTMCNTHTFDVEGTIAQCRRMAEAGARLIRITCPGQGDVKYMRQIREGLRSEGIDTPLVADIHFSSQTAIDVAPWVEKVRINPGNFHRDHEQARSQFALLLGECAKYGTAIRVGLNHGSLGERITNLYGNTPEAMARAAMEWLEMCIERDFMNVVVSLKSSNTVSMVQAYRRLAELMQERGVVFPLHVGVTEAGNGDSGRMKSCVGISTLLEEGLGNTIRVSLTEDPVNEIPVARYLCERYDGLLHSSATSIALSERKARAIYDSPSRERLILDLSCDFGKKLLDREIDTLQIEGSYRDEDGRRVSLSENGFSDYLVDELLQASRRRFYRPEYIACPGCGRTMYDLQEAFEAVKERTSHLSGTVIAVMGCIVNGPGEMADADWGYVGEGNHKVSIYKGRTPLLRHVPEGEAVDRLVELIEKDKA